MERRLQRTGGIEAERLIEYTNEEECVITIELIINRFTDMRKLFITFLMAVFVFPVMAFDDKDYKAYVEKVKKEVWSRDMPQFKNRNVPARFNNESAVILARYEEAIVDQKRKFSIYASQGFVKQINSTHLQRYLIKINDKAALEKFSTFDYRKFDRPIYGGLGRDDHRTVLGVKVIKADGREKEVSSDDYQDVEEGKKGKEKRAKLAVPDLQVGDMIDYFVYDIDNVKEENIPPLSFVFRSEYPILDYQVHCEIDKKLCTQYRALNGAPNFEASQNDDDILLDAHLKDIDKTIPKYGYNAIAQAPYALLYITGKVEMSYVPESTKKKGLQANPSVEVIQNDAWHLWSDLTFSWSLEKNLDKALKQAKTMTGDQVKADYLYNYCLLYSFLSQRSYMKRETSFASLFGSLLDRVKVPYDRVSTTSWGDEPYSQLISYADVTPAIMLKNGKIYFPVYPYFAGGDVIPSAFQNREASRCDLPKKFYKGPFTAMKIPGSKAEDNVTATTVKASVDASLLHIVRQSTMTGCEKEGMVPNFATAEEIVSSWGKPYGYADYAAILDEKPAKAAAFAKERAEQDKKDIADNFKDEIEGYHQKAPVKINATQVTNYGNDNQPFIYQTDYTMDGLVKKAGKNLTISVGQLIGPQKHLEGRERKRTEDVYYDYPSSYKVTIDLELPAGYSVSDESLQKLNTLVDNAAIHFETKTEQAKGKVIINVEKVYKKQIVPVAEWDKLLEALDRAYAFTNQQVILKKD